MALSQALMSRTQQLNDTSIMFTRHLLTNLRTTSRQRMDAGQSRAGFFCNTKNYYAHIGQIRVRACLAIRKVDTNGDKLTSAVARARLTIRSGQTSSSLESS